MVKELVQLLALDEAAEAERETRKKEQLAAERDSAEGHRKVPVRVLWVDDNPANNRALIDQYRSLSISFDLALNTKQALDLLAQGQYALIISDIGRDTDWEAGIHMIPEIRSRFPHAPPIIIYAHPKAVEAHEEKARNLGANLVTASREQLISWLDNLLSQRD